MIKIEENDSKGRAFVSNKEGKTLAEMTFSKAGEELIIIDHTEVADELRGKSVGKQLLNKLVEMARAKNIKIMPLCPFAKSVFDKDESIRDVLN
ncbi:GNAT family N-acetyltransferase [Flammeovirgaceae bacterium SG7u.111]|nr:GNAT family N-acetyltransferase [Flammeovirgaceae bacterium SG7u.132]WPO33256.1 GNAT family N-acetyltransferase [Flammeovirgaceae bacterium SG7u.111]